MHAAAGLVVFAQPIEDCPNWGHLVLVDHRLPEGGRVVTLYGHILPAVAEGSAVEAGEPPGLLRRSRGSTSGRRSASG